MKLVLAAASVVVVAVIPTVRSAGAAICVTETFIAPVKSTMSEFTDDGRVVATTLNPLTPLIADARALATAPFEALDNTLTAKLPVGRALIGLNTNVRVTIPLEIT